MIYRFRFRKESTGSETTYRPKIEIILSHNGKQKEVVAVLDTGSDFIFIPRSIAQYFDLPLSKETGTAQGVGTEFEYQFAPITIKIDHQHKTYHQKFQAIVPQEDNILDVILGSDFLQNFIVTFDYPKHIIKLNEKIAHA